MSIPLSRPATVISFLPLFAALAIFTAFSLHQLPLPGLHYDEAQEVIPAVQLILGHPTAPLAGGAVLFFGRQLPLMIQNYIGAINTYLALPFFKILGISVFSLRLIGVVIGILTLVAAYRMAKILFDFRVASLTALLLAINPSFIFWSRQGTFVTSVLSLLTATSLFAFVLWYKTRKPGFLYLGFFILGVGVWAKLSFLWFWGGFFIAGMTTIIYLSRKEQATIGLGGKRLLAGLLFLIIGASPLLLYNLQTQGTVEEILRYLNTSYYGLSNIAFFSNLGARISNLNSLLDGGHLWYLGTTSQNLLSPLVFWLLALTIPLLALRRPSGWGGIIFLALLMATMLPLSVFTVSDFKPTHYVLFFPLPQMFIAAGLSAWSQTNQILRIPAIILALALLGWDLKSDLHYHRALALTGGYPDHSAAIYDLADYLAEQGQRPVVAMDWGFRNSVYFLTLGQVDPDEIFGYESFTQPDPGFVDRLRPYLNNSQTLYLFHTPEWTIFQRKETFRTQLREVGKRMEVVKNFSDRSGMKVFVVATVIDNP
ncbi:MAG: glycosyltransferase family 39 protein [Chloroflexi bacterium]|nr:glycosyltransferase family 39 protein [Chloroflexota bacterium]